jgi:N-acetyl-alpha-D-muramate 1-phosphate uridylyltransferase
MMVPHGTKAMIFAAGLGTRLKPFTDKHPKALAPVNGKPLLQRNIEYLKQFGIKDIIVNVHHFADQIITFIEQNKQFGINISISHEVEEPLETGGGLKKAGWFFEDSKHPFVVCNADILTDLDLPKMYAYHQKKKGLATLAVTHRKTSRNFLFNDDNLLVGWENNKTGEHRISRASIVTYPGAFTTVHVIEPRMIPLIPQTGKFSIIDTYLELAKTNDIYVYDHTGDVVVDVGKPEQIQKAELYFH